MTPFAAIEAPRPFGDASALGTTKKRPSLFPRLRSAPLIAYLSRRATPPARAAGLGIVLASQSPAHFDYRSREQINTWFLGRISDQRSIDKMKPLFEHRPAVGGKLGTQDAGRFVMLQDGGALDLGRTPSMLRTEQLPEAELMSLAARGRG